VFGFAGFVRVQLSGLESFDLCVLGSRLGSMR
jgi:hypothetical protein